MAETSSTPAPETWSSPRSLARLVMAFLLAQAIWAALVSLTNNLVLPLLAGAMGDPASPLSLGKSTVNVAGLFASGLELCFAGLVAAAISMWPQRRVKVVRRMVRVGPATAPTAMPKVVPAAYQSAPAAPAQPAKPKPPKEVIYNSVGEPISPMEEE
jgi:hypothetical protein